jgi:hypothetical protein
MNADLRFGRFWFVFGWVFVATAMVLSLIPSRTIPMPSWNDKFEHALGYLLLTLWFCGIYRRRSYGFVALWMLAMGILVELLQGMMHLGRKADIHDVYADILGIGIAVLLALTPLGRWPFWLEKLVPKV